MDILKFDSPLMQKLALLFDLMVLNVLTVLLSLPIVTIGAATTALYDATWRLKHNRGTMLKDYWRTFCSNLKQATVIWLFLLLLGALLVYNLLLFIGGQEGMGLMVIPMILGAVVWVVVFAWVFVLQSRFQNKVTQTVINALLCGLRFLPQTIAASVLNLGPWVLLATVPEAFYKLGLIWALFWFGFAAYSNICLLDRPLRILSSPQEDAPAAEAADT